jgi:hypothetical protein
MDDGNHQTFRRRAGLRGSATQMGRRTYFRVTRSPSKAGKGFRSDNRQRRGLGVRCAYPNPHPSTRKSLKSNAMSRTLTLHTSARCATMSGSNRSVDQRPDLGLESHKATPASLAIETIFISPDWYGAVGGSTGVWFSRVVTVQTRTRDASRIHATRESQIQ